MNLTEKIYCIAILVWLIATVFAIFFRNHSIASKIFILVEIVVVGVVVVCFNELNTQMQETKNRR